jgi:hypothetical protein
MDVRSTAVCGIACAWLLLSPQPVRAASEAVNCIPETTDMTIGYGTVLNGPNCVIAPGTDVDVFRFSASIGEVVRITVSNVAGPAGLLVQIRDPGGNLIWTIGNPVIGEGSGRFVVRTIEMSGSHSIAIFDADSDETATYGVVVERIVPAGPGAVPLAFNVPVSDELNPTNDIDQYRFEAQAGSVVRISVDPDITELGQFAMLQIASPSGPLSGGGEFSGSGPFFRDVTVTETGTQTFQLRPYRPDLAPYPYTVRIDCLSGPCAPPDCTLEVARVPSRKPARRGHLERLARRLGSDRAALVRADHQRGSGGQLRRADCRFARARRRRPHFLDLDGRTRRRVLRRRAGGYRSGRPRRVGRVGARGPRRTAVGI